jgi:hypothetical protein
MHNATELQQEALSRATQGDSMANFAAIYAGLMAKGIAESDISPRVNVLTFHAWRAKGRSVKKGEHGVKVTTWIPVKDKDTGEVTGKRCKTAVVFHISQTCELGDKPAGDWRGRNGRDYKVGHPSNDPVIRDPGEDAADRWNETHGDRWIDA